MRGRITKRSVDSLEAGARDTFLWDSDIAGFGVKATPSGKKVFVLQYRTRSQDQKEFATPKRLTLGRYGDMTPEQARQMAGKLLLEVRTGGDPGIAFRPSSQPTVSDLAARFLGEYLPNKKRRPRSSTIAYYEILFRVHVVPALGESRVGEVSTAQIEKLHAKMRKTPYIANRVLSMLQNAFDQAEKWGWRPQHSNPALHIERYREERRGGKKEVMLTSSQMAKLVAAIDAEEASKGVTQIAAAALRVAFWTGWRIGEVLALRWANLNLEKGVARLVRTKTVDEEYRQLPSEAIEVIHHLPRIAECPFVFFGSDLKNHLTTVRKPWVKVRKRAGLDGLEGLGGFRIHDLRHNVVSWDVSRGVALEIAGKNVGHRSRRSTEVYAHFAPDALKEAADERAAAMRRALESGA